MTFGEVAALKPAIQPSASDSFASDSSDQEDGPPTNVKNGQNCNQLPQNLYHNTSFFNAASALNPPVPQQ